MISGGKPKVLTLLENESKANPMTTRRMTSGYALTAFALMALLFQASTPTQALAASIKGQWRGSGSVKTNSGTKERVRCRVTYRRAGGQIFSVTARCASSAGRFDQNGSVKRVSKNRYVGTVYNPDFNIKARVVITARGKRQTVSLSSSEGTGYLSLRRR